MFPATWSATATWKITALGASSLTTARSGRPTMSVPIGHRTATAPGTMLAHGAGRGSATSLGVLLHTTTAAGIGSAPIGVGAPAPSMDGPFMVRPSSDFSAAASDLALDLVLAMPG